MIARDDVPGRCLDHDGLLLPEAPQGLHDGPDPRLTPAHIDAQIVSEAFHVFPGTTLTVCALTLRNGFQVVGESAAASPENFDQEIGRKIARDNARGKIWALEGYALRDLLAA